jgi:hypothetical protein
MARRVFFSFHYKKDSWRVNPVRNSDVTKDVLDSAGFIDSADWEEIEKDDDAIEAWINEQLERTTVTVVLIGEETSERDWVIEEIKKSYKRGNGMLGIYIHNIEDSDGDMGKKGSNPFSKLSITKDGQKIYLSEMYPTYDWVNDDGYENMGAWIEKAAKKAGK